MIYQMYQSHVDVMDPLRWMARSSSAAFGQSWPGLSSMPGGDMGRRISAALEVMSRMGTTHTRPAFGIDSVTVGHREVGVTEEVVHATPFCSLVHFKKDIPVEEPRVLVVAPMSGHFATLLRGTCQTMLAEHDVYITDWHNARDVPLREGAFDFDSYVDHLIGFFEFLGRDCHVVAVCQPSVAVLVAVAVMAQSDNKAQPRSMTLMAGPIDTRISPTKVNELAMSKPIDWFERKLISTVPLRYPGALRRVYPGFVQLTAFMKMNMERHTKAYRDMYEHLIAGEDEKANAIKTFYDEYLAVMDLPAEFFIQTVRLIFQEHALPLGTLEWHGQKVEPAAIRHTALFTVEGENDDICAIGQTLAAQDLCTGLRPHLKHHHLQLGAGHYGVFNGRRWSGQVYPMLRMIIQANS
ncbi:poly(3-hydroxybutyrate) depolymerase [Skermanella stibiiresistens SB22]|uniref:Poly(3-hydroxybutyrate) depolymerase n=1 Tax=Skermanella stibiiresistens SB22 TaxID=1385369 RepID=W9GZ82_9PROT|nr:polyhydroxyalkanoate depolymerase [Skermanella stibiiresistens]EWY39230.1 poly(3-hydroxybutyrate) depolymerase [Skermanella stibiiresistens SB22]